MSEPKCLRCKKAFSPYQCADACATAEIHQCRPIVTCGNCGAKNQIYSVTEYRVLKLFVPAAPTAATKGNSHE